MAAKTMPVNIYNLESVKPTILGLREELERKFYSGMEKQVGSNWAIDKIQNLFAHTHTLKVQRGASYLPNPTKYANSKCGLINPRNTNQVQILHALSSITPDEALRQDNGFR
jgi:hypothetical protein